METAEDGKWYGEEKKKRQNNNNNNNNNKMNEDWVELQNVSEKEQTERRKKMEEKMGQSSGVWVMECLCCQKRARKRNDGEKINKKKGKKYNKVKKVRKQGYGLDMGVWAEVWGQVEERGERKIK